MRQVIPILLLAVISLTLPVAAGDMSEEKLSLSGLTEVRIYAVSPNEGDNPNLERLLRDQLKKIGIKENPEILRPVLRILATQDGGQLQVQLDLTDTLLLGRSNLVTYGKEVWSERDIQNVPESNAMGRVMIRMSSEKLMRLFIADYLLQNPQTRPKP